MGGSSSSSSFEMIGEGVLSRLVDDGWGCGAVIGREKNGCFFVVGVDVVCCVVNGNFGVEVEVGGGVVLFGLGTGVEVGGRAVGFDCCAVVGGLYEGFDSGFGG